MKDILHRLTTNYQRELQATHAQISKLIEAQSDEKTKAHLAYVASKPGHMLRPLVALITYGAVSGKVFSQLTESELDRLTSIAAALELLHTASLVHDDVIDITSERRGQPTVNALHGNSEAVLVGNLFYLNAFRLMLKIGDPWYLDVLIETAEAMCVGEIIQADLHNAELTPERYIDIVSKKTGALIASSAKLAAKLAGANDSTVGEYTSLALTLGVMYQMRDDLQDHDLENLSLESLELLMATYRQRLTESLEYLSPEKPHQEALIQFIHYFKGQVI